MRLKTWTAVAAAITLPLISGCGNDNANDGFVRNINATSEYTSLNLYTQDSDGSDAILISATAANTASAYEGLKKGSYTFDVKSSTSAGSPTPVTGTVTKDDHFAVLTYLTGTTTKTQFISEEEAHPASGNAKLRVFNAATSEAASVDVYLTTHACDALAGTDSPFASAVTALQTSYTQVTASTWNVCVFATGDTSTLLLDVEGLKLADQEIATLVLTRTTGGVLLNGAVLDQQGAYTTYASAIARVRVVADASGGTPVNVTIGSSEIATSQPSPSVANYVTVPTGTLSPTIVYGSTSTSGYTLPAVAAGNDYTLLVAGSAGAPAVTLITDNNTPSTSTTNTVKARVINGLNGTNGAVSATVDGKSVGSASFGAASTSYTSILPTSGTSTIHGITTGTNPTDLVNQTFSAGSVYTIFIYGDATAPTMAQVIDR
ncbi:MAG TPA: DUF4397 domain-containing protein [Burkholderiaceae bacterium]